MARYRPDGLFERLLAPSSRTLYLTDMITVLANPQRFLAFSRVAAPILGAAAVILAVAGLWLGWSVPPDYQQGATVRMLFIHLPSVFTGTAPSTVEPSLKTTSPSRTGVVPSPNVTLAVKETGCPAKGRSADEVSVVIVGVLTF